MFFSVSVSLSIFAYNSIRVQQTNINDQKAWGLLNQIFAIQFECITCIHDKTKIPQGKYYCITAKTMQKKFD